jgi:hypothetical protein
MGTAFGVFRVEDLAWGRIAQHPRRNQFKIVRFGITTGAHAARPLIREFPQPDLHLVESPIREGDFRWHIVLFALWVTWEPRSSSSWAGGVCGTRWHQILLSDDPSVDRRVMEQPVRIAVAIIESSGGGRRTLPGHGLRSAQNAPQNGLGSHSVRSQGGIFPNFWGGNFRPAK